MQTQTDLDTISKAWTLLDEIGLAGLLTGAALTLNATDLFGHLLTKQKLKEFISIITNTPVDQLPKLTGPDVIQVLTDFFTSIAREWSALSGLLNVTALSQSPNAPESTPSGS